MMRMIISRNENRTAAWEGECCRKLLWQLSAFNTTEGVEHSKVNKRRKLPIYITVSEIQDES